VREQVSKLLLALWIYVHLCQPNAIYVHAFVLFLVCVWVLQLTSANGLIGSTAKVSAACTYPNGSCI
jgi:hypothetical protein